MQDTGEHSRDGLRHTVSYAPPSRQLPFTFFTQSDARISRRLKFLGRTLQVISIAPVVQVIDALFKVARLSRLTPDGAIDMTLFTQIAVSNIGFSASLYFAGRALLLRKAWGAYFTIATALFPAILFLLQQDLRLARGRTFGTGVSVIILMLVASVWNELHPKQAVEIGPHADESPQMLQDGTDQVTTTHLPLVSLRNGPSDNDSLAPASLRNRASDNDSLAPAPLRNRASDNDSLAPAPLRNRASDNDSLAPAPLRNRASDNDSLAPATLRNGPSDNDSLANSLAT